MKQKSKKLRQKYNQFFLLSFRFEPFIYQLNPVWFGSNKIPFGLLFYSYYLGAIQ